MKLKIPPVLVLAICLGLMWGLDQFIPVGVLDFAGHRLVGKLIFGLGMALAILGDLHFL